MVELVVIRHSCIGQKLLTQNRQFSQKLTLRSTAAFFVLVAFALVNTAFLVGGQEPTQVGLQTTGARRTSASRTDRSRGSARWAIDVLRRGVSGGARLAARGGHPLSSAHHDEVGPPGPPADPLAGDGATAGTQQSTAGKRQSTARERGKST